MTQENMRKILEIGVLLSSERDLNRLLERILSCVMELACCDAGTLYLQDGDFLRFKITANHTLKAYSGGDGREPDLAPVPLKRENVCAMAFLEGKTIRIEDVKNCKEYNFSGPIRYDQITGYDTRSMLVTPMTNRRGERIGVLQLINALDGEGRVCPFAEETVLAVESVASQAAITIQNARYLQEIKALLHSLIAAMSSAVDERTPYNGSHTRHMAAMGGRFLDDLNRIPGQRHFTPAQKEELLMSIWLHDCGKVATPLEVMNKESRLLPEQRAAFAHRMEVIRLLGKIDCLSGKITPEELEALAADTEEAARLVGQADRQGFLSDGLLAEIQALGRRTYTGEDGAQRPWLAPDELDMLSIRKGTLSPEERKVMEGHVTITDKILSQIHFPSDFSHVRQWAAAHHELLDGSGYPNHLSGKEIPLEVRIITILDIFDALVADDRPYKRGMPAEKAYAILEENAARGQLDPELVRLFIESRKGEQGAF